MSVQSIEPYKLYFIYFLPLFPTSLKRGGGGTPGTPRKSLFTAVTVAKKSFSPSQSSLPDQYNNFSF